MSSIQPEPTQSSSPSQPTQQNVGNAKQSTFRARCVFISEKMSSFWNEVEKHITEEREMERLGCRRYCQKKVPGPYSAETEKCLNECIWQMRHLEASRRC